MNSKESQYPPRGGKIKAIRIKLILDYIDEGLISSEIDSKLSNSSDKYCSKPRGECSVTKVKRSIYNLSWKKYHIGEVIDIPLNSHKDKDEKHDLEIKINDGDIGIIGVQVKSSGTGVSEFYKSLDPDIEVAKRIAIQRRLIVLNGSLEDNIIANNFIRQLQTIYQYFKTKN